MKPLLRKSGLSCALASVILLSACSTTGGSHSAAVSEADRIAELDRRAAALDAREQELNALSGTSVNGQGLPSDAVLGGDLLPPNAAPGECYARVWVDAEYKTSEEQVLVSQASKKINVIPAQYETVTETVEISAASSRLETIPAVYGTESEQVLVRDSRRVWRVGNKNADAPASDALLVAATNHGIDLTTAQVGMCFHEHYVPATFRTESESVLVKAATEQVNIVPAQYETVEKRVLVREASTKLVNVPAEYGVEEEQIIDKPAHTIWKKGTGPIQRIDEATGEIMCLVEVPATYKTVKRTVLVSAARTETVEIPAEYETVQVTQLVSAAREERSPIEAVYNTVDRQVVDSAAGFAWHEVSNTDHPASTKTGNKICLTEIPAEYRTVERTVVTQAAQTRTIEIPAKFDQVQVTKLVSSAREEYEEIPAEYRTVEKRELMSDGYMAWRSILCDTNMTSGRISDIQRALRDAGHDIGPNGIDGVIGTDTIKAVNAFQRANELPVDKYLNIATLEALGVSAR